jgi:signal transduction histidine kinase
VTTTTGSSSRHRLDALYHLAVELSAQRRLEAVLDTALRQCLDLTESEFGFIGLVSGGDIDIVAIHGFHPAPQFFERHHSIPLRPNVFAQVVLDDRPVRTVDARTAPNRVGQPGGHPPVGAFMGVPLRIDGSPIGMIGLANRPEPYDEDHERLVLTYAGLVAMHVHNAQLFEALETTNDSLERLVAERTRALADARDALADKAARLSAVLSDMARTGEQERLRIASDLHDSVNQLLIAAMLEITSAQRRSELNQHEEASASLESAQKILSQVESEIRWVIHDLHPPVLDALGLTAAVRELVERFAAVSSPACALHIEGEPRRLPSKVEIGIYRMLQEALHNACSHANAQQIDVSLTFGEGHVIASVADDGAGFDPAAMEPLSQTGFGLESMRRRIEDLAGRFALSTRPGLGTNVLAWVPETQP